jgi:hypothetical protein
MLNPVSPEWFRWIGPSLSPKCVPKSSFSPDPEQLLGGETANIFAYPDPEPDPEQLLGSEMANVFLGLLFDPWLRMFFCASPCLLLHTGTPCAFQFP